MAIFHCYVSSPEGTHLNHSCHSSRSCHAWKGVPCCSGQKTHTKKNTDPVSSDLSWWKREQSGHWSKALKSPACWLQPAWNILVWLDMVRSSHIYPTFKVKKNQDRSSRFECKQHFFWSFFGASKDPNDQPACGDSISRGLVIGLIAASTDLGPRFLMMSMM